MVWILDKYDDETIGQIDRHGDRSAAILAASCLEDRLSKLLRAALDEHENIANSMFKGYGPLATFQSKIDMSYMIGMSDTRMHKTMLRIKEIRNEFAHSPRATSFKTRRISDLCSNFRALSRRPKNYKVPKASADQMNYLISNRPEELFNLTLATSAFGRDTPRRRYMLEVKVCLAYFYILQTLVANERQLSIVNNTRFWPWSFQDKYEQPTPPAPPAEAHKRKTR